LSALLPSAVPAAAQQVPKPDILAINGAPAHNGKT
jgi:hypothetical protein